LRLPGLNVSPMEVESGLSKFDLSLAMIETEEGLSGSLFSNSSRKSFRFSKGSCCPHIRAGPCPEVGFRYHTDLFDASTIARMVGHFERLLREIPEKLERPVWTLTILSEAEKDQLLRQWNQTDPDDAWGGECVNELFREQVRRVPEAIAVVMGDERLSYGELNRR